MNERVQVYVRVRPIFKHELVEDMQAAQTVKQLKSPSPAKGSNYRDNLSDDDDQDLMDLNSQTRTGCVKFTQNQP